MSEAQAGQAEGEGASIPPPEEMPVEQRARLWGWKPKDQWKGAESDWVDAEQFVARGTETPAVLKNRYNLVENRLFDAQRALERANEQIASHGTTLAEMTKMLRSSDERGYQRALRELERKRDEARAAGDIDGFAAAQTEIDEHKKTAPPPAPSDMGAGAGAGAGAGGGAPAKSAEQQAAEQRFLQRNPWYAGGGELQREADGIYVFLTNTRRELTPDQVMSEVERRMRVMFPDKIGIGAGGAATGAGNGAGANADAGGDRGGAGSSPVSGSGEDVGGRRPRRNRRDFDSMPKESKDNFEKYKRQLAGKGEPLTKEEWAQTYWAQFPDEEAA